MDYQITDNNADFEGFSYLQQKQLSDFFEKLIDEFEDLEDLKDENSSKLIETVKKDISELNSILTSETKNGFMKKFSLVLAKTRKRSLKVCDFILKEFTKEIIKKGTEFAFNCLKDNMLNLPN